LTVLKLQCHMMSIADARDLARIAKTSAVVNSIYRRVILKREAIKIHNANKFILVKPGSSYESVTLTYTNLISGEISQYKCTLDTLRQFVRRINNAPEAG